MDYKYIEQLVDRYFECETTLEEEQILRMFFSQENVPARLLAYREIFMVQVKSVKEDVLSSDFDSRIMAMIGNEGTADKADEPQTVHVKARIITMQRRLRPLYKAAAVVAIILTLGNAAQMPYEHAALLDAQKFAAFHAKDTTLVEGNSKMAMADSAKIDTSNAKPVVMLK